MELRYHKSLMHIALDKRVSVKTCQGMLVEGDIIRVEAGKEKDSKKFFVVRADLLEYLISKEGVDG